jgi:hypothetical protein
VGAGFTAITFVSYSSVPEPCPPGWTDRGQTTSWISDNRTNNARICSIDQSCKVLEFVSYVSGFETCPPGWTQANASTAWISDNRTNNRTTCILCP